MGKQLYGYFKWQVIELSHKMTWISLKRGNLQKEIDYFLIPAQNNTIRTNHIVAKIDKTQQNSKYRLCGDKEKTNNNKRMQQISTDRR